MITLSSGLIGLVRWVSSSSTQIKYVSNEEIKTRMNNRVLQLNDNITEQNDASEAFERLIFILFHLMEFAT